MFDETTTKLELSTNSQKTDSQSNIVKVDFSKKAKEEKKVAPVIKPKATSSSLFPSLNDVSPWIIHVGIFFAIVTLSLFFL